MHSKIATSYFLGRNNVIINKTRTPTHPLIHTCTGPGTEVNTAALHIAS